MAVTSIWTTKNSVARLIRYVRNPEKTVEEYYTEAAAMHTIGDVLEYVADDMKTERREYVTCLNCDEDTAAEQFIFIRFQPLCIAATLYVIGIGYEPP